MCIEHPEHRSRREFLAELALAGTAALLSLHPRPATAEPPPETTALRLGRTPAICQAPSYLAQEFLSGEGFTDAQHVLVGREVLTKAVASRQIDMAMNFAGPLLISVDVGEPIVMLAGGHVGCFELFGTDRVRAIRDLKGKTVSVVELGGPDHVFLASMVAYVGLNPQQDITWVTHPFDESTRLLAEGEIDAVLAFPPQPQELRAKQIGHVVVNSMMDRPWSGYFCCIVYTHPEFVRKHPAATKRALRAILQAADLCAREPERVARFLVDRGFTQNYDYALQTLREMGMAFAAWREFDPEDTLRFYALRLHEAGMLKSSPQKLIAQGTDWRFFNELKQELKG
jgi:NitT/TauT family transport system substrate-binding protein